MPQHLWPSTGCLKVECNVLKVSGHLIKMPGELRKLLSIAEEVHKKCKPVIVVPGGSIFADAVLETQRQAGFSNDVAHWIAIKSMEVYGVFIALHSDAGIEVENLEDIEKIIEKGFLPIVLPYKILKQFDELPHSWDVTSDSIAVLIAGKLGCKRVFLAKLVNGISDKHNLIVKEINSETLDSMHQSVVDKYMAKAIEKYGVEVIIFNALKPERLKELICKGFMETTEYTVIKPMTTKYCNEP